MKHLRKFNEKAESIESSKTINSKYKELIDSKDIVIDSKGDYIKVKCAEGITIPELEELSIKKESDNTYYILKIQKLDIGDFYAFDMKSLKTLLEKPSIEVKSELEEIYNKRFNDPYHQKKMRLRELFFDIIN
jgi:hypothetical protein